MNQETKNAFIAQTAKDYCMTYKQVEQIYNTHEENLFYEKLEEELKQRTS